MRRELDLIDVWFDSGSMPYAQWHYPFENQEKWKRNFPANFIAEGVDQTRYFALIDVFFQQQRTWAFGGNPLEAVTAITRQAGITQAQFEACLNNQAILDALNATRDRAASAFGVESTPTFFINGKRLLGAQPAAEFEKIIDPLLPA